MPQTFFREWRQFRFLTQTQLGKEIGVAAATISRIESGQRTCSIDYLFLFARAIGCQPGDPVNGPPKWPGPLRRLRDEIIHSDNDGFLDEYVKQYILANSEEIMREIRQMLERPAENGSQGDKPTKK